jgi:hypothetical protein
MDVPEKNEAAMDCDPFGYLRQARLFDERGLVAGLDTRLDNATVRLLVETASGLGLPPDAWSQAVAPRCHRYNRATGAVVLQYPPGHGFLLSLFPEGVRARSLHLAVMAATAAMTFTLVILADSILVATLAAGLGIMVTLLYVTGTGYWSATPSLLLAIVLARLGIAALAAPTMRRRIVFAALIGLMLGFATDVRIANGLLLAGYGAALAALMVRAPLRATLPAAVAAIAALAMGVSPTLYANAVNAGSVLSTPYGAGDTSAPSLAVIAANAEYYFTGGRRAVMLWIAVAAASVLVATRRRLPSPLAQTVPWAVAVNLGVGLAFFLTHAVTARYYLMPIAVWCAYTCLFAWSHGSFANPLVERRRGAACAAAVAVSFAAALAVPLEPVEPPAWNVDLPRDAVIWTDVSGGMFVMHRGLHAATLPVASPAVRSALMDALHERGVAQVLVRDSDEMGSIVARLDAEARLVEIGNAFGADIYLLAR